MAGIVIQNACFAQADGIVTCTASLHLRVDFVDVLKVCEGHVFTAGGTYIGV